MNLWAFATSPHGLAIPEKKFWYMSFAEYNAFYRVWENSRKPERFQWAEMMALLWNSNGGKPAKSAYDYLPDEKRPANYDKPWIVKDVESQKLSIMQALAFAAGANEGKQPS